jgi:Mg-chelatase subunit ChlD
MDTSEGPDTLFLLSDGNPSTGKIEDIQELRDEVLAWNLGRSIRIHCVNVGDADARLLRALASSSGGTYLDLKSDRPEPPDEEPKK